MDFGQPNAEIGQKMANDRLLFLALLLSTSFMNPIVILWNPCGNLLRLRYGYLLWYLA